jgi:hypothetical protein
MLRFLEKIIDNANGRWLAIQNMLTRKSVILTACFEAITIIVLKVQSWNMTPDIVHDRDSSSLSTGIELDASSKLEDNVESSTRNHLHMLHSELEVDSPSTAEASTGCYIPEKTTRYDVSTDYSMGDEYNLESIIRAELPDDFVERGLLKKKESKEVLRRKNRFRRRLARKLTQWWRNRSQ